MTITLLEGGIGSANRGGGEDAYEGMIVQKAGRHEQQVFGKIEGGEKGGGRKKGERRQFSERGVKEGRQSER